MKERSKLLTIAVKDAKAADIGSIGVQSSVGDGIALMPESRGEAAQCQKGSSGGELEQHEGMIGAERSEVV
jgi:hypothetical protein